MNDETKNTPPRPHARMFEGKSMTKQSFRDECDINLIIRRGQQGLPLPVGRPLVYGSEGPDFHTTAIAMANARTAFEELHPDVQEHYGSLEGLLEAMNTPEGLQEAAELGVIVEEGVTSPTPSDGDTDDPTPSQPELDPPLPADPGEAGTDQSSVDD